MRIKGDKILAALSALDVELRRGVSLAEMTSLGIGGTTDLLRIKQHEAIPELLKLLDAEGVAYKFLGGGSNLLVVDGELPFVVLQLVKGRTGNRVRWKYRQRGCSRGPGTHGDVLREK